jgi:hypothetical protein
MKKLVSKLETKLNEKGLDLNITGLELMQAFDITLEDMASLCESVKVELYDDYWIECSIKYISKLKKLVKFDEGIYWYKKASDESPEYETMDLNTVCEDCEVLTGHIIYGKGLGHYSASLLKIINGLKDIIEEDVIKLSLGYLGDCLVMMEIDNTGVFDIRYEISEFNKLDEFDKNMLLYQLIVLSYKDKLIDVLKVLKLK